MPDYIAAIHDLLRKEGFPEDVSGTVQQVLISPGEPPRITTQKQDEFRSRDNQWSLTISEDVLILVTTAYDRFQGFADRLRKCLEIIDQVAEIRHGQVHRIGLRYVDVIDPRPDETFHDYLQSSFHGLKSSIITSPEQWLHLEFVGRTSLGTMVLRITQNEQGMVVPPEIMPVLKPMDYKVKAETGKLITLIDTDHFVEGAWDYDLAAIMNTADELHAAIDSVWFQNIITPYALNEWGAENVKS